MKIQIVSWRDPLNPKAGGAEVCVLEIGKRLVSRFGHDVRWFAPEIPEGRRRDEVDRIPIERRGRFSLVHLHVLERFLRQRDQSADLYLEDYHGITLGLGWFLKKPHVILVHEVAGPIWLEMWGFPVSWAGYALEKLTLRLLARTHFIAVSESTRRDLVTHGIPAENISVIREGADIARIEVPRPRAARQPQLLFLGRVCKMKRVDLLIEAFAIHRASHPGTRLVLAGTVDEGFRAELESVMRRLRVEGSIEVRGRVSQEEKTELLRASLALVSCSMREGFGLVVVEASSQGTPSLTFRVNGYRDLIEEGKNGYMVDYPDVEALASKLNDLASMDAAPYEALCATSLVESAKYSWDDTAAEVDRIFARVAAGQGRADMP